MKTSSVSAGVNKLAQDDGCPVADVVNKSAQDDGSSGPQPGDLADASSGDGTSSGFDQPEPVLSSSVGGTSPNAESTAAPPPLGDVHVQVPSSADQDEQVSPSADESPKTKEGSADMPTLPWGADTPWSVPPSGPPSVVDGEGDSSESDGSVLGDGHDYTQDPVAVEVCSTLSAPGGDEVGDKKGEHGFLSRDFGEDTPSSSPAVEQPLTKATSSQGQGTGVVMTNARTKGFHDECWTTVNEGFHDECWTTMGGNFRSKGF